MVLVGLGGGLLSCVGLTLRADGGYFVVERGGHRLRVGDDGGDCGCCGIELSCHDGEPP